MPVRPFKRGCTRSLLPRHAFIETVFVCRLRTTVRRRGDSKREGFLSANGRDVTALFAWGSEGRTRNTATATLDRWLAPPDGAGLPSSARSLRCQVGQIDSCEPATPATTTTRVT